MAKRRNKFDTSAETPENARGIATTKNKYTKHDLLNFVPKTEAQRKFCNAYDDGVPVIGGIGCPGVGKTFLATRLAIESVLDPHSPFDHIVIIRSAVAVRDSGFVPGTIEEKDAMYEAPYREMFDSMFKFNTVYDNLKALNLVSFNTTTYLRGRNFPENAIIIVDEIQNFDYAELCTSFSRTNENSRVILIGDSGQTDIGRRSKEQSGFAKFMRVLERMKQNNSNDAVDIIQFDPNDIVRSGIVREFYKAQYELNEV